MENDKNVENNNSNFFNENSLNFKQVDLKKNIKKVFMIIKIIFIFCAFPFLLVGTIFVSVSCYNIISNSKKSMRLSWTFLLFFCNKKRPKSVFLHFC